MPVIGPRACSAPCSASTIREFALAVPEIVHLTVMTPYPGTEIWHTESRRLTTRDYRLFDDIQHAAGRQYEGHRRAVRYELPLPSPRAGDRRQLYVHSRAATPRRDRGAAHAPESA